VPPPPVDQDEIKGMAKGASNERAEVIRLRRRRMRRREFRILLPRYVSKWVSGCFERIFAHSATGVYVSAAIKAKTSDDVK